MAGSRGLAVVLGVAVALGTAVAPPGALADDQAEERGRHGPLTLWYDEPATDWESQALPLGNGALGATFLGAPGGERLQFNEKTLWTGGPGSREGYTHGNWTRPRPGALDSVRQQLAAVTRLDPRAVADQLGQPKQGYGAYQDFGELALDPLTAPGEVTGYERALDIGRAVGSVSYVADGTHYLREYFASAAHGVVVARLSARERGRIGFTARVSVPDNRSVTSTAANGRITIRGALSDNGLRYEAQVQVRAEGGSRVDNPDGSVTVTGADAAVLVLGAGTDYADTYPDYRGADPHQRVTRVVDRAAGTPYPALLAAHQRDYRALFDRVRLDVGQRMPDQPTDALLAAYTDGTSAADRALEALYFQYGRYLLISSSRAGSLPANLQGVWNNSTTPPWSGDYHTNINLQMNYWPAEVTNLTETTGPLFDFVDALREPGRVTARQLFDSPGWVVNNETNPFGFTGVHDWPTAFWFPEAGAWLAQQYYDHYRFTRDERFLRERAYPVLRELTEFWLDQLRVDPRDGSLVVTPSFSPEHGDFSSGAAMSQQIVWDLLTNTVEAAEAVGEDAAFLDRVRDTLSRLDPGTRIGSWGQLQEWKQDWDDPADDHRHVSHLFGLHPGRQIAPGSTPELARAAEVSLTARGDGGTGWSKAWKINFWARLLDGDHAHRMLAEQLRTSTLANLWDTHPPFQIDGNFGATAGVAELLVQSQHTEVHLLPALPASWPRGSVAGLRARGDVTVGASWAAGRATQYTLTTGHDGPLTVRGTLFQGDFALVDVTTGARVPVSRDADRVTFTARAGHHYLAVAR
ncbi:glycoside hydrolase family 95 protein [Goodfellowiella coeruleoviolacea]|uniref:Alpha-L-fucosidase 2 n=1 Tax=Goodfellowiella coeruleoviolacea TaxID=334858 RepID=A0AAE3KIX3_9PSEU|nr:glycoside hydrolase family 95 protein [Goodfellowiella coeruleoviolacea]MCP2163718.1 alpha-L-fucosidase 2 [Goodfellowiella coeruleoviolacea]